MSELKADSLLQGGKYKIEKSLGQGGFGITYLAEQTNLGRKVCIKEFFMKEYGERTESSDADSDATVLTGISAVTSAAAEVMGKYRDKFVKEAKTIARLDHPGIVRIHDVFEENGTAYYVMDFIEGENLNDKVKREGPLSEEKALGYIRQVADALSYVHDHKIMHLDVKPANIIVRKSDDKAILIDFGAAKQYDSEGTQTSTTPIGLSIGYAPIEMNKPGGVQTFSPETDVYSLGATLYYLVTGQNPPEASERMEMIMEGEKFQFSDGISNSTAEVIEQSMQARKKRVSNVSMFLEHLEFNKNKERLEEDRKAAEETWQEEVNCLIDYHDLLDDKGYLRKDIKKKDFVEYLSPIQLSAERGEDAAKYLLRVVLCYFGGFETDYNNQKAFELLKASSNDWFSQCSLGVCYSKGLGTKKDFQEAELCFNRALDLDLANTGEHIYELFQIILTQVNSVEVENGHEYVDLGLPSGTKWSMCSIGAFVPTNFGDFFACGETSPKSDYSFDNYRFYKKTLFIYKLIKYDDANSQLSIKDDAAKVNWGGRWRMPSSEDFDELIKNTHLRFVKPPKSKYGFFWCTSQINGASLIFPATGFKNAHNWVEQDKAFYWTLDQKYYHFNHGKEYRTRINLASGLNIRPIIQE